MSKILLGLCAFVLLVITPSVKADTIVITSGSLTQSIARQTQIAAVITRAFLTRFAIDTRYDQIFGRALVTAW